MLNTPGLIKQKELRRDLRELALFALLRPRRFPASFCDSLLTIPFNPVDQERFHRDWCRVRLALRADKKFRDLLCVANLVTERAVGSVKGSSAYVADLIRILESFFDRKVEVSRSREGWGVINTLTLAKGPLDVQRPDHVNKLLEAASPRARVSRRRRLRLPG